MNEGEEGRRAEGRKKYTKTQRREVEGYFATGILKAKHRSQESRNE
jgi:hypothetical protein